MSQRGSAPPRIAIIGSGFGGLCLGIQLKRRGIDSFTILEKASDLGGTWRDNTYPGAACDAPSFLYCFAFEPKTDWSRKWAPQPEILQYMRECATKYDLLRHIRFDTEVAGARFDADAGVWRIRTRGGDTLEADFLVSAVGQLSRPRIPKIAGCDDFTGESFHSARWNHAVDLDGKRVAVIGNAASAVQLVPAVAPRVAQLDVYQRSANWMFPKHDHPYSEAAKRRFARHPRLAWLVRAWIWLQLELAWPVIRGNRFLGEKAERLAKRNLRSRVPDPELRRALVPDFPIGGKRTLISDDYYEALGRENVELVREPIERITPGGIRTRDGVQRDADVIVFATGFDSTAFLAPIAIEGKGGLRLASEWKDGAEAYLGITVSGFPNFFMLYGPNTNLGHNSIIFMIEAQTRYILDCIEKMRARGIATIDLRRSAQEDYNARIQRELAATVWAATDHSWYKTEAGKITNNWSGSTLRYWWKTRRAQLGLYDQVRR